MIDVIQVCFLGVRIIAQVQVQEFLLGQRPKSKHQQNNMSSKNIKKENKEKKKHTHTQKTHKYHDN